MACMLARLLRREDGNVAMIFALAIIPFLVLAGAAIDIARANMASARLQAALDTTALAIGSDPRITQIGAQALAEQFFAANYDDDGVGVGVSITATMTEDEVSVSAEAVLPTTMMSIFGYDEIPLREQALVARGGEDLEVVMVLDNTGSMRGSRINALRDAADSAVGILFDAAPPGEDRLRVGLVPFSSTVNVGTENARAWWLDPDARSPLHSPAQSFDRPVNRWDLFDELRRPWTGCVEARRIPFDIDDTPPDVGDPETLFVPYFAPDEPGRRGRPDRRYTNSYLDDGRGGSSTQRQTNARKYDGGRPHRGGPDWGCTARPIVALTDDRAALETAIDGMIASGTTNIHNAVGWGLRVLSPEPPFEEGRRFNQPDLVKAMIILTDGDNFIQGVSNHNMSYYTGYGFIAEGRLGVRSRSSSTIRRAMDDRTEEACRVARDAGVRIYTITFQVRSAATRRLMENCASRDESGRPLYFDSPSSAALEQSFTAIARDLTELRLAR